VIRIERTDPLGLLRELPDGWAQSVITGPAHRVGLAAADELPVIFELARVTRPDATLLWDIDCEQQVPLRRLVLAFALAGWQLQKSELACRCGHLLFAKQPGFYWRPAREPRPLAVRAAGGRRPWCIPAQDEPCRRRLERLLLAATTRSACGACGAPRPRPPRAARPGIPAACGHLDRQGRCLLIDPFHMPASPMAGVAVTHGRSYLGVLRPLAALPEPRR
jgi:hypothetical protein